MAKSPADRKWAPWKFWLQTFLRCRFEKTRYQNPHVAGAAGLLPPGEEVGPHCSLRRPTRDRDGIQVSGGAIVREQFQQQIRGGYRKRCRHLGRLPRGGFGKTPTPFLGYPFLLEDCAKVKTPVRNKEPYFKVDPAFDKASYCKRYELPCRRLVLERSTVRRVL